MPARELVLLAALFFLWLRDQKERDGGRRDESSPLWLIPAALLLLYLGLLLAGVR